VTTKAMIMGVMPRLFALRLLLNFILDQQVEHSYVLSFKTYV
jgi:hypothetical protein